jgi:hypothetical protein
MNQGFDHVSWCRKGSSLSDGSRKAISWAFGSDRTGPMLDVRAAALTRAGFAADIADDLPTCLFRAIASSFM